MKTTSLSAAIALAVFSTGAYAYTPGTYTAAIAGQNGPVKVEVTTSADKILSVKIVDQKETEGIGSKAVAALPAEIVKAQSANVQSIAGASVSSAAIKKAVQECLNQAQGKKAAPLALKNGTFEGKAYGNNGWLTVEVTIKDNKITDIKTPGQRETKYLGDTAIREIGKDVHEKTGKYLLTSEATGGDTLMMMMQSCGANFVNEDGEAYIVGNDTAEKCINLYVDLVKNDVVKLVNNWDEYIATITSGEAAGIVNGNWITATLMSTEDQKGLWQITTMPKVDDVESATNYANNGGSSWYITSNCKNVELAEDFLASTFGSSTDFYDAILPASGAISCYLPAGESEVYNEPNEFFGGQPIFSTIVEYSSHIPEFTKTPYHYESRECVNTAVINIVNGTSVEDALQEAQDTLAFKMTE